MPTLNRTAAILRIRLPQTAKVGIYAHPATAGETADAPAVLRELAE